MLNPETIAVLENIRRNLRGDTSRLTREQLLDKIQLTIVIVEALLKPVPKIRADKE